ncbi:MAG: hypothetical protein IKN71_01260 [Alphaproteobacteria bacterium]|nr:hypothetical protein [Alphaproteobacteria bacterium]
MNDEVRAQIWQLCQYLQSTRLNTLSDEDLTALFRQSLALKILMQSVEHEPVEQQVVDRSFEEISAEAVRRKLVVRSLPVEVVITKDGKIVKGLEELRFVFRMLSFEDMMDFIDSVLEKPINDAQRKALLNLAYEKVYADEEAN